ncbi:hypothetical protein [Piscinibacter sp.]|jgi:hypothetical protein|uniref:hypothetical protein n=1 Tax=Piscinibacter sp. TaxID=1903157 RepID=UPI002F420496
MTPKPDRKPQRDRYPDSLSGGEPREPHDHRVGETQRQNPRIDQVDPAQTQPEPAAEPATENPPADSDRP